MGAARRSAGAQQNITCSPPHFNYSRAACVRAFGIGLGRGTPTTTTNNTKSHTPRLSAFAGIGMRVARPRSTIHLPTDVNRSPMYWRPISRRERWRLSGQFRMGYYLPHVLAHRLRSRRFPPPPSPSPSPSVAPSTESDAISRALSLCIISHASEAVKRFNSVTISSLRRY